MRKIKTLICMFLVVCAAVSSVACQRFNMEVTKPAANLDDNYQNSVEYVKSPVNAVDDLDRVVTTGNDAPEAREGKYVGIFYFLWIGEHTKSGEKKGPFDNNLVAQVAGATSSEEAWMEAGGGPLYAQHYWGKPLYGYYTSSDEWVMEKHVQMLTDADIDFVVFDTTNGSIYADNALLFLKVLDKYYKQGFDVPQVAFYTNTDSGITMNSIYNMIYKAHPEYEHLWFNWNGKPLMIGVPSDTNTYKSVKEFFTIKESQWPNDGRKKPNGFPWMEFDRSLTDAAVYGVGGRKEVVNVSIAQHSATVNFSATAWYGADDRTRSWHDGANDTSEDAYLYGYNFAEQWEWALGVDPEIVFITGWNEWVAQRQEGSAGMPIRFVDCADPNNSRDAEPMEGGYGDNYYMQMISYIRQFKGTDGNVTKNAYAIDINNGFSQWNDVSAYYKDYTEDTVDRLAHEFDGDRNRNGEIDKKDTYYEDTTGRNDIAEMKVTEDKENVYFFVKTVENITAPEGNTWMNLFIGDTTKSGWNGYNYVLNYIAPTNEGKLYLGKLADGDEFSVIPVSEVSYRIKDNMMMVAIPKDDLGIKGNANINFKWSDNCTEGDLFGFYKTGDAAPIGRAGYYYGE